jgi:hypothetical protein
VGVAIGERENQTVSRNPSMTQSTQRRQKSSELKPQALFGWNWGVRFLEAHSIFDAAIEICND